jgi:hypothetical protein
VMDVAFVDESTSGVVRGATHLVSVHISLMCLRIWGLDHCAFVASFYWMQFPALGRAPSCGASQIVPKSRVSQAFQPPPRCLNTEYLYDFEKLSGRNDAGFFSNQLRFLDQCLMTHSLRRRKGWQWKTIFRKSSDLHVLNEAQTRLQCLLKTM